MTKLIVAFRNFANACKKEMCCFISMVTSCNVVPILSSLLNVKPGLYWVNMLRVRIIA